MAGHVPDPVATDVSLPVIARRFRNGALAIGACLRVDAVIASILCPSAPYPISRSSGRLGAIRMSVQRQLGELSFHLHGGEGEFHLLCRRTASLYAPVEIHSCSTSRLSMCRYIRPAFIKALRSSRPPRLQSLSS